MSKYIALARKYRPKNFQDVIGHKIITVTLTNAIKLNRVPHAILLTGSHGIGKTTLARIIIKSINCLNRDHLSDITAQPDFFECECYQCKSTDSGYNNDVIEMDAATHTGVNDVREIIENSRYKPVVANMKAYIIDEVHMLSVSAFNALLKILEEPPLHVVFILATTEANKIPLTVLSRCQRFHLRKIPKDVMFGFYRKILDMEGYVAADDALWVVVKAANGSVRDGLSILDQVISLTSDDKVISYHNLTELLGFRDVKEVLRLYKMILSRDISGMLDVLNGMYESGIQPHRVVEELLVILHALSKHFSVNSVNSVVKNVKSDELDKFLDEDLNDLISLFDTKKKVDLLPIHRDMIIKSIDQMKLIRNSLIILEMLMLDLYRTTEVYSDVSDAGSVDHKVTDSIEHKAIDSGDHKVIDPIDRKMIDAINLPKRKDDALTIVDNVGSTLEDNVGYNIRDTLPKAKPDISLKNALLSFLREISSKSNESTIIVLCNWVDRKVNVLEFDKKGKVMRLSLIQSLMATANISANKMLESLKRVLVGDWDISIVDSESMRNLDSAVDSSSDNTELGLNNSKNLNNGNNTNLDDTDSNLGKDDSSLYDNGEVSESKSYERDAEDADDGELQNMQSASEEKSNKESRNSNELQNTDESPNSNKLQNTDELQKNIIDNIMKEMPNVRIDKIVDSNTSDKE